MKKCLLIVTSLGLLLGGLAGCGKNKTPTNKYEKVQYALNGVEKSFKNIKAAPISRSTLKKERLGGSEPEDALATIFSYYTKDDKRGSSIEDLEYDQPPMIQFQYLKKVFEKVGDSYSFGTKYYDTVTGDIYLDMETGFRKTGNEYKYNYEFTLGIDIDIDDNDLIDVDVSFDITLKKDNKQYQTKWYVGMELDYDMNNSSPNYTLLMITENNEIQLPFRKACTYEYDYVEVKNNSIKEWRKFDMQVSERLVKDSAHQTIDDYLANPEFIYTVGNCSWFKDDVFYKFTRMEEGKKRNVANALFTGLGLNANEINADEFFNKTGTKNEAIRDTYQEFCSVYRDDIIYSLVIRDKPTNPGSETTSIRAIDLDTGSDVEYYIIPDISFGEMFSYYVEPIERKEVHLGLYYADDNGTLLDPITDLTTLSYKFGIHGHKETVDVSIDDTISLAYQKLLDYGLYTYDQLEQVAEVTFRDNKRNVEGRMPFIYSGELPNPYVKPSFPKDMVEIGVPEYEGERVEFFYIPGEEKLVLEINNTNYDEGDEYTRKLFKNDFLEAYLPEPRTNERGFNKVIGDNYLYVSLIYSKEATTNILTAWLEPVEEPGPKINAVSIVGDFNNWDTYNNCIEFNKSGDNFYLMEQHFAKGDKIKIVVNHTWEIHGGYGYSDIQNIEYYPNVMEQDVKDDNIIFLTDCLLGIEVIIADENITFMIMDCQF